jgi:UV DNA damage repair endonuclease
LRNSSNFLINQIQPEDDKDKSMMASSYPELGFICAADNQQKLKQSDLAKSTYEKVEFITKADKVPAMYKENLIMLMNYGFKDFDICYKMLVQYNNSFEKALDGILTAQQKK